MPRKYPTHLLHYQQQPELLLQARMDPCCHVVHATCRPYHQATFPSVLIGVTPCGLSYQLEAVCHSLKSARHLLCCSLDSFCKPSRCLCGKISVSQQLHPDQLPPMLFTGHFFPPSTLLPLFRGSTEMYDENYEHLY